MSKYVPNAEIIEAFRGLLHKVIAKLGPQDRSSLTDEAVDGMCDLALKALASPPEVVPTMPRSEEIRLACGELTAGEMRTAKAVLQWFISTRCQPQKERS